MQTIKGTPFTISTLKGGKKKHLPTKKFAFIALSVISYIVGSNRSVIRTDREIVLYEFDFSSYLHDAV